MHKILISGLRFKNRKNLQRPEPPFGEFRHIFGFCVKKLYSIAALIDA